MMKFNLIRGGAWSGMLLLCRPAYRDDNPPGGRYYDCGFRVVRVPRTPLVKKGNSKDGK